MRKEPLERPIHDLGHTQEVGRGQDVTRWTMGLSVLFYPLLCTFEHFRANVNNTGMHHALACSVLNVLISKQNQTESHRVVRIE